MEIESDFLDNVITGDEAWAQNDEGVSGKNDHIKIENNVLFRQ